ncbi:MAG: hypothetical protein LAQ30_06585 [Acidobacteriia bacterium]|nr:hypothetical protein [Terriglobia bacterium]
MQRSKPSAYQAFRALGECEAQQDLSPRQTREPDNACRRRIPDVTTPVPLRPYRRCTCGVCRECADNAKWDRIFKKFEARQTEVRGLFQCALNDF